MEREKRILIVDENIARAEIIREGLREAGFADVIHLSTTFGLLAHVRDIDPDVIVVDMQNPSRDTLEQMFEVSRLVKRPVTMFVDQSDAEQTRAAVEAGVSAYIVDGLRKERIKPVIDMCILRFEAFARLEAELREAKDQLRDRGVIDQAKHMVMKAKGLDENAAYALLRTTAMRRNLKIAELARAILAASDLVT
jgi:two-component system, response regulator / RNA-binding antiterminator